MQTNGLTSQPSYVCSWIDYNPSHNQTNERSRINMVIDSQTNKVYFSSLLPETCPKLWSELQKVLRDNHVDTALLTCTNDIWCRDFMPIQIAPDEMVFYEYNPDYLQKSKKYITNTKMLANMFHRVMPNVGIKYLNLKIDGGNVVKCGDTIVMTEKVFHENSEYSREVIEEHLRRYIFDCDIMFLPWDKSEKYGHSDGIIHYLGDNKVLLTNYDDFDSDYYHQFKTILEQKFEVIPLHYPVTKKHKDNWCYVNYLQIGNLVIVPQLGIPEDEMAIEQIQKVLPDAKVVGVSATEAVKDGGALNCLSWNIDAGKAQLVSDNPYDKDNYLELIEKAEIEPDVFSPYLAWLENRENLPTTDYMSQLLRYIDNSRTISAWLLDSDKQALQIPELTLCQKYATKEDIKDLEHQIFCTDRLLNAILHDSLQIEDANKFSRSNVLENAELKDTDQNSSQSHDNIFYEEEFGRFFIEDIPIVPVDSYEETISPSIPDDPLLEIRMPPIDPPIDGVPF